jgi:hypothetical protein
MLDTLAISAGSPTPSFVHLVRVSDPGMHELSLLLLFRSWLKSHLWKSLTTRLSSCWERRSACRPYTALCRSP